MGAGYWFDPRTKQSWTVDRHELWVLDERNAKTAGISQEDYEHLLTLDSSLGMNEIRMAAINVGLVRIRDHGNYVSVQFASEQVQIVLRSIHEFLSGVFKWPETEFHIDNFTMQASTRITLRELGRRLDKNESVLGEPTLSGANE